MVTVRSPDADAGSLRGNRESAATTPTRYITASIVRKDDRACRHGVIDLAQNRDLVDD
jgi:hypothetical protein